MVRFGQGHSRQREQQVQRPQGASLSVLKGHKESQWGWCGRNGEGCGIRSSEGEAALLTGLHFGLRCRPASVIYKGHLRTATVPNLQLDLDLMQGACSDPAVVTVGRNGWNSLGMIPYTWASEKSAGKTTTTYACPSSTLKTPSSIYFFSGIISAKPIFQSLPSTGHFPHYGSETHRRTFLRVPSKQHSVLVWTVLKHHIYSELKTSWEGEWQWWLRFQHLPWPQGSISPSSTFTGYGLFFCKLSTLSLYAIYKGRWKQS